MKEPQSFLTVMFRGEHDAFKDLIKALVRATELAYPVQDQLSYRIALGALQLGHAAGLKQEELRHLFYAALLHHLGGFIDPQPLSLLPGKGQPETAEHLTRLLPTLQLPATYVRWQAEAWDGSGGPDGLRGDQIPLPSQIIGLSRAYTMLRIRGQSPQQAQNYLNRRFQGRFQPALMQQFQAQLQQEVSWSDQPETGLKAWSDLQLGLIDTALLSSYGGDELRDVLEVFARVIDTKHSYTLGHSKRVSALARMLGQAAGMQNEALDTLEYAGLLHDIGKLGIPGAILDKPGKLDAHEFKQIQHHPLISDHLIGTIPALSYAAKLARHHHEKVDGQGYPDKLHGEQIPLGSRILAIADAYDAMTSSRAYREGMPHTAAMQELGQAAGKMHDAELLLVFNCLPQEDLAHQLRLADAQVSRMAA